MGLLFENLTTLNPETSSVLGLYNRGTYGTGHGWGAAHSVAWRFDVAGRNLIVQKPPTAQNYAIGSFGNVTGNGPFGGPAGFIEGNNTDGHQPRSLYLEQLAQRLGTAGPLFNPGGGSCTSAQTVTLSGNEPRVFTALHDRRQHPDPRARHPLYSATLRVHGHHHLRDRLSGRRDYRDGCIGHLHGGHAPPPPPPVAPAPVSPPASGDGGSWGGASALILIGLAGIRLQASRARYHGGRQSLHA